MNDTNTVLFACIHPVTYRLMLSLRVPSTRV